MPVVRVDPDLCKGCERCVAACPQQIIRMSKRMNTKGYFVSEVFDQSRCIGCMMCAIACPDVAIEVSVHGTRYQYFQY